MKNLVCIKKYNDDFDIDKCYSVEIEFDDCYRINKNWFTTNKNYQFRPYVYDYFIKMTIFRKNKLNNLKC